MWRVILVLLAAFAGFWFGSETKTEKKQFAVHPEKEFPISEHKAFVIVLYAHNQALWCERALHSVFEQDYDHYRVILVDDGSTDGTLEKAKQFIIDNNQDEKAILIRNESMLGPVASLYRAIDSCLDREIVIPLDAKDWLSSPFSLKRINAAYQNPDVWIAFGQAIDYPSYEIGAKKQTSFYSALFKQILLQDLYKKGVFATNIDAYLEPLLDLSGGRVRKMEEPIAFFNSAAVLSRDASPFVPAQYGPLSSFPKAKQPGKADILVFSFDRPLQLYACLESIQRYITGYDHLTVLYRVSNEAFADGYEKVKDAFPQVHFVMQSPDDPEHDFKKWMEKIVFGTPSDYIVLGVDDIVVKDFVDLKLCMDQMEKTGAYGFYLSMGKHINFCYHLKQPQSVPMSQPLASGVYAWDFQSGECDWAFPNSLELTVYRKASLREPLTALKYKSPISFEHNWAKEFTPKKAIGLYFERSKLLNIPMNVVDQSNEHPHMDYLSLEELLAKFNQGLKIDIEPLYKVENASPHVDYVPEFILR